MNNKKKKKSTKRTFIEYGIIAAIAFTLYATGLHTEVIGFMQRGILATGLMTPKIEATHQDTSNENENEIAASSASTPADFNLALMDENGKTISLTDFQGKPIFMNMWATWCPPCIAEMPNINKLHKKMGSEVAFIMVSLDDDFETAKAFNKRKGFNLPIYTLQSRRPPMYQSSTVPTTYVIDANGQLVLTHKGMANYNTSKFRKFLKGLK
ncbi:MAG: TlpA disulfide reductase family protein [Dysgonamonadaceae bacterium]|nr:TlpA disulfide reductase family protein [Dysgonamonadaceae bacterium]MDD4729166.1 TlpA disulfide reductase family protein [Dysgonamonadaceae bacterium]